VYVSHAVRTLGLTDRRSLLGQNNDRQKGSAGRLIHGVEHRATDEKTDGECETVGNWEQSEEDGGGEVGEDHGLDEAEAFCETGGEDVAES
jgi:hypothetical protein